MKALIFTEGNGYGHAARDCLISEHFGIPIMTFGKGAEYCRKYSANFIEIPTPLVIQSGVGKVKLVSNMADIMELLRPEVISEIKDHLSKVDFVIVDGASLGLAVAGLAGKKSVFITNDTSSLIGVYGAIEKKFASSLYRRLLDATHSIVVPDFPPPLTISMLNMNPLFPLKFCGPLVRHVKQKKHNKRCLVVGSLENELRPLLGDDAVYGSDVADLREYYASASLVISHGGHTSIMEALSYGKPVLCVVDREYAERYNNALMLERRGVGVILEKQLLSEQSLSASIEYAKTLDPKRLRLYRDLAGKYDPFKIIENEFPL